MIIFRYCDFWRSRRSSTNLFWFLKIENSCCALLSVYNYFLFLKISFFWLLSVLPYKKIKFSKMIIFCKGQKRTGIFSPLPLFVFFVSVLANSVFFSCFANDNKWCGQKKCSDKNNCCCHFLFSSLYIFICFRCGLILPKRLCGFLQALPYILHRVCAIDFPKLLLRLRYIFL